MSLIFFEKKLRGQEVKETSVFYALVWAFLHIVLVTGEKIFSIY